MSAFRLLRTFTGTGKTFVARNALNTACKRYGTAATPAPAAAAAAKPKSFKVSTFSLVLLSSSAGAVGYALFKRWHNTSSHKELEYIAPKTLASLPNVRITKRFVNPQDTSGLDIVLFQFQTCPFCCKVRAFLDYHSVSYAVVEVDAVLRQDLKWSSSKQVPMMLVRHDANSDYMQLTDSSAIISILATVLRERNGELNELGNLYPQITYFDDRGKKRADVMNKYFLMRKERAIEPLAERDEAEERRWRQWADDHLVHLISPNCYQTMAESIETFEWFSQSGEWHVHFPKWERNLMVYGGASAMYLIAKLLKRRHNLDDDVRSHMYDALNAWTNVLQKRQTKFLAGVEPGLADLSIFGVLSSMEGCQAFKDCLKNTNIGDWFYAVKEKVNENRGQLRYERVDGEPALNVA